MNNAIETRAPAVATSNGLAPRTPAYRRALLTLSLGGLANFALIYYVQPLLPDLARTFAVSEAASGLALSSTTLSMLVGLLIAAPLSDRIGRMRTIAGSLIAAGVLALLCALAPTWEAFLALRAGLGLALAVMPAAALAYVRETVREDAHIRANATYIAGTAIGGAAGRLAPIPLTMLGGWQSPTIVLGILSLATGIAVILLLPRDEPVSSTMRITDVLTGTVSAVRDRRILLLSIIGAINMVVFVAVYNTVSFRLEGAPFDLGASEALMYLAYPVGIAAPTLFGWLSHRLGRHWAITLGSSICLAAVAILVPSTILTVFVGLTVLTVAFLGIHSVLSGWVVTRASRIGLSPARASSAYLLFYYAGSTVGGTVATALWIIGEWTATTAIAAVGTAVMIVLCSTTLLSARRHER